MLRSHLKKWLLQRKIKSNGAVIYQGNSLLNNEPIIVIATGLAQETNNRKTGDMIQIWIMPLNESPIQSVKSGYDATVCGDCKHRPSVGGACYVNTGQAPTNIYKAFKEGKYPFLSLEETKDLLQAQTLRFGAWGDPAAVPSVFWNTLLDKTLRHTAYTHQWRNLDVKEYGFCMASVDSPQELQEAHKRGWRTFRVKTVSQEALPSERECLSETKDLPCATCGLCDGNTRTNKLKSIWINAHGAKASRFDKLSEQNSTAK